MTYPHLIMLAATVAMLFLSGVTIVSIPIMDRRLKKLAHSEVRGECVAHRKHNKRE